MCNSYGDLKGVFVKRYPLQITNMSCKIEYKSMIYKEILQ